MDLRVLGTNLRRLRCAKGLSQDDLAYEAEVSRSYVSPLEKGAFCASPRIVGRLAMALEVEAAELLRVPRKGTYLREEAPIPTAQNGTHDGFSMTCALAGALARTRRKHSWE